MATKKSAKKGRVVTVDMEGVESGGRTCPDGTYVATITEVEEKTSKTSGEPMLVAKWKITDRAAKGVSLFDNLSLQPQALWRLKSLLEGLEIEVPDSTLDLDLDELVDTECRIVVENETYEGKQRPRITGYLTIADKGEEEEEEEEEKPKSSKKSSKKPKVEEEEEEETEEEEEEDAKPAKKPAGKFKEGTSVKFRDDKNKIVKGTILEIDGDSAQVEDKAGETWEIELSELETA